MNSGGFSSFGTGSGFNTTSTNLFSSNTSNVLRPSGTSGIFGSTTNQQPLGTSSQPQSGSLFSTSFGGFSGTATQSQQQVGTTIKFAAPSGQDTISKNGQTTTINTNHQCITAMKEYELKSLEELRFEDYQANRKFPSQSSQFGGGGTSLFSSTGTTSGFGGSNLFGSSTTTQANRPLIFGSTTGTTTPTQPQTTGLFGQTTQPAAANRSFFSSSTTGTTGTTTGFTGFGSQPATQSVFGATQPQTTQPSIFGGIGQTTTTAPSTGLFGSSNLSSTTSTGLFSQQANKPLFSSGFGQTTGTSLTAQPAQTSPFNFNSSTTTAAPATQSIFGAQTNTQSPISANKPFGSTGFGTGGLTSSLSTGFGGASTTTGTTGGIFGSITSPATQQKTGFGTTGTTSGFGGFGSTTGTTASTTGTTGGMFGFGSTTGTTQPSTGLNLTSTTTPFGSTSGLGGSAFGSTATGGLFGSGQTTTQPATTTTTGGLFGSQPSTGFGSPNLSSGFGTGTGLGTTGLGGTTGTTTGTSIFGTTTTQQPSQFGLGLGTSTTTPGSSFLSGAGTTSGFGSFGSGLTSGQTSGFGGGGLGLGGSGLMSQQNQQQQLQMQQLQQQAQLQGQDQPLVQQQLAALSNSPYGGHLLRTTLQDLGKKEDIFKPLSPIAQRPYITEATSPVKITSILPSSVSDGKGGLSQTIKITPKPLNSISLNKKPNDLFEGLDEEEVPCFYPRKNIKKLLFKPSGNTSLGLDINTSRRSSANSSVNGDHKVDFMGRKSGFQDESLRFNTNQNGNDYAGNYLLGQLTTDSANVSEDGGAGGDNQSEASNGNNQQPNLANVILERPGYFIIPPIQDLATYVDAKGDCLVDNFAIGRVDYGCITFPGITNIANMNFDEIIHIRRKEVHVYPDDTKKPPVGQGLNKLAEITLHRIWPTDKETKKAITDPNRIINMGYNKKIEKVTEEMGAQFIDYDPSTGSWTFKVKHFSKYGFHDSDDEDETVDKTNRAGIVNNIQLKPIKPSNIYGDSNNMEFKQEKDMIQKQLKLIEARRLELSKAKYNNGPNLNTLKNQQWEMLNEYTIPTAPPQICVIKIGVGHLDLSTDSQEIANDDYLEEDEDKQSMHSNIDQIKKTTRKSLAVFNEHQIDEEEDQKIDEEDNKENSCLYPSLRDLKNKKPIKKDKIYPSLSGFEQESESYKFTDENFQKNQSQTNNLDMDSKDYLKGLSNEIMVSEEQFRTSDLPFVVSSNDRMLSNTRSNRSLMKAFFNDEGDDFAMVEEDTKVKMTSLMQKPQQFGLVKRGLGGISNEELLEKKMSFKKETTFSKLKQFKNITTMFLNLADVQQRIDTKALRPKLWNRFLLQKTMKLGMPKQIDDQLKPVDQYESNENLAKYNKLLQMQGSKISSDINSKSLSQIPYIKYSESIIFNLQHFIADAAIFESHRFRVNWSMYPTATTFTNLDLNLAMTNMQIVNLISPSTVSVNNLSDTDNIKLSVVQENCAKFLNIQLELTDFIQKNSQSNFSSDSKLQLLRPKPGNDLIRNFFECTQEIRNQIVGDHPDADNVEHMKCVWSLCQNLWGDVPDNYKIDPMNPVISSYETEQIRKRLLSEWLAEVSAHRVERQCKMHKFNKKKENHLDSMFCLLTGNRLLDACLMAADNQDYRLSLMMSQSTGGNKLFRDMINKQINEWLMSGTEKFLNMDRLKFYVLISGNLTLNSPNNDEQLINTCENLDWKRQFGLHLWYKCLPVNSIHDALRFYEKSLSENICVKPLPPYLEDKVSTNSDDSVSFPTKLPQFTSNSQQNTAILFKSLGQIKERNRQVQREVYDTCYHLIKLYCDENYSIADTISPLSHSSNQLDFRLSWHLSMALVSLNYKYISKECLENLHDSFASQLQSLGLWHWSIFILMHIENEQEREKYVKNYLSRYVTSESELNEKETFLIEKLKVPSEWIYDFKAHRAKYECLHENQLKLLIKAHKWNEAHNVLVDILGPEFYIKRNFKTLNDYLAPLSKEYQSINKWNLGGQVYLDAIKLNQKAQFMFDFSTNESDTKSLDDETLKEIHDQITNLSSRIKEIREFNCPNPKKLLVCIKISKLLLNFFNILMELNNNTELNEEQESFKMLTKLNVEKAFKLTNSVPSHDLIQTMLMKKTKYARDFLMSRRGF